MSRKAKKKDASSKPGQALLKNQVKEKRSIRSQMRSKDDYISQAPPEKSVTEMGNLEEFLEEAELAGREFEADREAKVFQVSEGTGMLVQLDNESSEEEEEEDHVFGVEDFPCTMPRRPHWVKEETSPEELEQLEKQAFLEWRRHLAKLEKKAERQGFLPSPFEKNLNFWRQLWRVMERSHVLVQVVDARNPLLFRFPDMEKYAHEVNAHKRLLLVINKADLLTDDQVLQWKEYFDFHQTRVLFFSALEQTALLSEEDSDTTTTTNRRRENVCNRQDLLDCLHKEAELAAQSCQVEEGVIGMVGYPNVGKSSLINALLNGKKVSVSATPGHTKHFQTMRIEDRVTLCDCPGLVFPSFFASKADMLCNGILPIDEIRGRDFVPALEYVCKRVPKSVLESTYHMRIMEPPGRVHCQDVSKLLEAFCVLRGFYAQGPGRIDESKGSRLLLKDYVSGRLLYCHPPPGSSNNSNEEEEEHMVEEDDEDLLLVSEAMDLQQTMHLFKVETEEEVLFEEDLKQKADGGAGGDHISRRLANHGRKHKKGRDKNPYDHVIDSSTQFGAKLKGKRDGDVFTRKVGHVV